MILININRPPRWSRYQTSEAIDIYWLGLFKMFKCLCLFSFVIKYGFSQSFSLTLIMAEDYAWKGNFCHGSWSSLSSRDKNEGKQMTDDLEDSSYDNKRSQNHWCRIIHDVLGFVEKKSTLDNEWAECL